MSVSNTDLSHKLDDHGRRLADLEQGVAALTAEVDLIKQDRTWLRATLLRVLGAVDDVRHSVTIISQRSELTEQDIRGMRADIQQLSSSLDERPCYSGGCPPEEGRRS